MRSISTRSASAGGSPVVSSPHLRVDSDMILSIRASSSSSFVEKCWWKDRSDVLDRSTTSSTVKSVRPVSPRIASADFMKRLSRGSASTSVGDRPLGFAIVALLPGRRNADGNDVTGFAEPRLLFRPMTTDSVQTPWTVHGLLDLFDVQPDGENRFIAETGPAGEDERHVVEGSQLLAQAIVAVAKRFPDKSVRSVYAVFARAVMVSAGPVELEIDVVFFDHTAAT